MWLWSLAYLKFVGQANRLEIHTVFSFLKSILPYFWLTCINCTYWGLAWYFYGGLGFETRALHLLALPLVIFCFTYFLHRVSHFCPGLASDSDPPTYWLLHGWDYRDVPSPLKFHLRRNVQTLPGTKESTLSEEWRDTLHQGKEPQIPTLALW
jgi:hypothetical protein